MSANEAPQFKVKLTEEVLQQIDSQSKALGFHSSNALAAVYVSAIAAVPADKVWQVLSVIRRLQKPTIKSRKAL